MAIVIQDGQRMNQYFGANGDSTFKPMEMPIIGANKKPIRITNTGVIKPTTPTAEEKAKRRTAGEVWDEITKTWKKVDESGIIDRTLDLFNDKGKTDVTIKGGKVIVEDNKNSNTDVKMLAYVVGSALIILASYVAYKKLR